MPTFAWHECCKTCKHSTYPAEGGCCFMAEEGDSLREVPDGCPSREWHIERCHEEALVNEMIAWVSA